MSRDVEQPEEFIPERFLGESAAKVLDPDLYSFGFGRRFVQVKLAAEFS